MSASIDLVRCVEAVNVLSPTSFSFAGKVREVADGDALIKALTETIYDQCYCKEFKGSYREFVPATVDARDFLAALGTANATVARWDKDWVIDQVMPGGQYLAVRNNRYRVVSPGEFITVEYHPALPQPGMRISIYCQKESATLQPAFYFAFSHEPTDPQSLFTMVRFYWNVRGSGAARLLELLTTNLNAYAVPFSFKCLNHPGLYPRIDAAVLYVAKPYYGITARIVSTLHAAIESELDAAVPWFTKRLDKGLGLAEDPGNGESFGMARCGMVARGICKAAGNGGGASEDKIHQVEAIFAEAGISEATPYLNAGSKDVYDYYK